MPIVGCYPRLEQVVRGWLVFNGTFNTNSLYCAIGAWNTLRMAADEHKI